MSNYTEKEALALLAPTPSANRAIGLHEADGGTIRAGYGGKFKQMDNPYDKKRYNGGQRQHQPLYTPCCDNSSQLQS
jgi:hypothetical protein